MSKNIKSEPDFDQPAEVTDPSAAAAEAASQVTEQAQNQANTSSATAAAAAAPNRRTFKPVLTARRAEKDTSATVKTEVQQQPAKQPRRPFAPNTSNRGGRGRANLIQTHSILEAGPAESTKRFGNSETAESYSRVVGPSGLSHSAASSSIGLKKSIKPESDDYFKTDKSFIDDGDDDDTDAEAAKRKEAAYVHIKFESKDHFNETDLEEKRIEKEAHLNDLFSKNEHEEKLVLMQMPENLNLNEMSEGRVGKLRFYRSGRVELCLNGEKYLNVSLSVAGPFLQEAVALELLAANADPSDVNKMTNLGQIQTKLVCSPIL